MAAFEEDLKGSLTTAKLSDLIRDLKNLFSQQFEFT
jgi:hypothetical protein